MTPSSYVVAPNPAQEPFIFVTVMTYSLPSLLTTECSM